MNPSDFTCYKTAILMLCNFSTLQYKNWHSKFDKFWQDHIDVKLKGKTLNSIKLLWVVKVAMSICFENKGGCTYWHNTIVSVSLGGIEKVHKILKLRTFTKKVLELRIVREQAGRVWRQWNDNWFTSPEPSPPHCHVLLMLGPWGVVSILARGNIKHPQGVVSTWTWR